MTTEEKEENVRDLVLKHIFFTSVWVSLCLYEYLYLFEKVFHFFHLILTARFILDHFPNLIMSNFLTFSERLFSELLLKKGL